MNGIVCVPIKLYLQKQAGLVRQIGRSQFANPSVKTSEFVALKDGKPKKKDGKPCVAEFPF